MATLSQLSKSAAKQPNADDFYAQYGPLAAPLREALGFNGQNDVDMFSQSRVNEQGGEGGSGGAYLKPSPALQAMIDAGQVEYGNLQNHDPTAQDAMGYWVNWDKMPTTAFGSGGATGLSAYDPSLDKIMLNSNAKVNDPNFGWVTPTKNLNVNQPGFWETFYNVAPSLFTMGMGSMIAAPALTEAMAATHLAQTVGEGGNPTSGLISMLGSYFGVPSTATSVGTTLARLLQQAQQQQQQRPQPPKGPGG